MREVYISMIERIDRGGGIESFRFKPDEPIGFCPGQFMQFMFDEHAKGNRELNKYLSLSCAPDKSYLEVTKRLSGSLFSKRLQALVPGERVLIKAPLGSCFFREEYKKICFLAGGIGITPAISIIEHSIIKDIPVDIVLFYSNRTEDIAFRKELDTWRREHRNLNVIYTVSECQPKDASCIFGVINKNLVLANTSDIAERVFFIFGPPLMVEAMKSVCLEAHVGADRIKTEGFLGY